MRLSLLPRVAAVSLAALVLVPVLSAAASTSTGTGTTADLSYAPTKINFGRLKPLQTATAVITITNTSALDLTFAGAQTLNPSIVFFAGLGGSGNCLGLSGGILAAGATCTLSVVFMPPVKGSYKNEMLVYWSSDGGSTTSDVTGTVLIGSA